MVDNPSALSAFASDFASLPGKKVLIHGGGKAGYTPVVASRHTHHDDRGASCDLSRYP